MRVYKMDVDKRSPEDRSYKLIVDDSLKDEVVLMVRLESTSFGIMAYNRNLDFLKIHPSAFDFMTPKDLTSQRYITDFLNILPRDVSVNEVLAADLFDELEVEYDILKMKYVRKIEETLPKNVPNHTVQLGHMDGWIHGEQILSLVKTASGVIELWNDEGQLSQYILSDFNVERLRSVLAAVNGEERL